MIGLIIALLVYLAIGAISVTAEIISAHSKKNKGRHFSPAFLEKNALGKTLVVAKAVLIWPVIWPACRD